MIRGVGKEIFSTYSQTLNRYEILIALIYELKFIKNFKRFKWTVTGKQLW